MTVEKLNPHYSMTNPASIYDEEALTALELAGRTAAKVNEVVDAQNKVREDVDNQINHVIPETIANDVQDHIENGDFDAQINEFTGDIQQTVHESEDQLRAEINQLGVRVDNLLGQVTTGSTSMDAEIIDMRTGVDGKAYTSAGDAIRKQVGSLPFGREAILESSNQDLNTYTNAGTYVVVTGNLVNKPSAIETGETVRYLVVEGFGPVIPDLGNIQTWGKQTLIVEKGRKSYTRYFQYNYGSSGFDFEPWFSTNEYSNCRTLTGTVNLNTLIEPDKYIVAVTGAENAPIWSGFLLEISVHTYGWVRQDVYGLHNNACHYYRIGNNPGGVIKENGAEGLNVTWSEWKQVISETELETFRDSLSGTLSNQGYTIVNMGDSIFGNFTGLTSVSGYLQTATGASVHNFAFGGTRMTNHDYANWTAFSMNQLADAIATGDFSSQETYANADGTDLPSYFKERIAEMKSFDFSTVDVLTIAFGQNDFSSGTEITSQTGNKYDRDAYETALRYSIETLLNAYPNMRIVVVSPMWCMYFQNGVYAEDSDTKLINGQNLHDFVDACETIANEYHVPVVNAYDQLGINKFNYSQCYTNGDGIHPNENGRKHLAKLLAGTIRDM